MERASRNDWFILVRGVVKTLMVLAGEVLLHATVSMGGGGLLLRTGALADPTLQDVALMYVSGGLLSPVNCLIFMIFLISQEGFDVGIPTETREKSASTHGDNRNQHITTIDHRYFQTIHNGRSIVRSRRN